MRIFRRILSQLPLYVLFLLLSSIFVAWFFSLRTSAPREKKITLYADLPSIQYTELSAVLEKDLPEGIVMVRAMAFDQMLIDAEALKNGDMYIVPASKIDGYADSFFDYKGPFEGFTEAPGGKRAVLIYDDSEKKGAACAYIPYAGEDYYLFIGANSVHKGGEGSVDDAVFAVLSVLLSLE